jgi:hypothetical protein
MNKAFIWIILLGLIASGGMLLRSSTYAQGDQLATLEAEAGVFQVREAAAEQYNSVSGTVALTEGATLRWEPNAIGTVDFFNGLAIPVSTTGTTASEIAINRLSSNDAETPVTLSQTEGRVTYSLRNGLASGEAVMVESQSGATVRFADGIVELVEGTVLRDASALSSFSWRDVSNGTFNIGSFAVDFADSANCAVEFTPGVMVYNPGSATSPTRVGVDGNVRFNATNPDMATEIVINDLLIIVDGLGDLSICGNAEQSLEITANQVDEPVRIISLEDGDPIVSLLEQATITFGPGTGNPLQDPSLIVPFGPTAANATGCPAGTTATVNGIGLVVTETTPCEPDEENGNPGFELAWRGPALTPPAATAIEYGNPDFKPLQIGEPTCPEFVLHQSDLTGNLEIYRLGETEDDPVSSRNLSQGGLDTFNLSGALSPDGQYVAFASTRDGGNFNYDIYVTDVNGEEIQRATVNDRAVDMNPVWSPLGEQIVYQSNLAGDNWDLRIFDVTTNENEALTNTPSDEIDPHFSPDGEQVVFMSNRPFTNDDGINVIGRWQIYVLDIASGEVTRVSDGTANDYAPIYSSDGEFLAFLSDRDNDSNSALFISDADGSNITRVSAQNRVANDPVWAEDGSSLAYQSQIIGENSVDIFTYNVATGGTAQLTDSEGAGSLINQGPAFACYDPGQLLLSSNVDGDFELYSIPTRVTTPVDFATDAMQLTDNDAVNDAAPLSSPRNSDSGFDYSLPS